MIFILDEDQLAVFKRVETRLYDEMTRLTADDRRDLANAMNAVRVSIEKLGDVEAEVERQRVEARLKTYDAVLDIVRGLREDERDRTRK